MKIISFAYTTPALLAGAKTVTRRAWNRDYALRFNPDEVVQAYDHSPRIGGKCVGLIRVVSVKFEPIALMPDSDYEAEGFAYMAAHNLRLVCDGLIPTRDYFEWWRNTGESFWTVRFELVETYQREVAALNHG